MIDAAHRRRHPPWAFPPLPRRPVGGPLPTEAEFVADISRFLLAVAVIAVLIAAGALLIWHL